MSPTQTPPEGLLDNMGPLHQVAVVWIAVAGPAAAIGDLKCIY